MVIPVGVNAESGKEITFSAEALNLPTDIKFYIEDRKNSTFTLLNEENSNYKITLTEALNGVGRFYLHTSYSALNTDSNEFLNSVSIFKTNNSTLRIAGLNQEKTTVSLYNMIGKNVMKTSFTASISNDISLPNLSNGIYIVKVETSKGKITKKIILD